MPTESPVELTSGEDAMLWADAQTRDALQIIAEGITQLAGFEVAAVSVVRDPGHMQVMAVAGSDEARKTLEGTFTPIERLLDELEHAEDWGMFQFVPHERLDPDAETWGWVPDLEINGDADAWHPMDLLVAPLRDSDGVLRGTLSIDCPTDGRRPDPPRRRILERYAAQAARALVSAVEREELAEEVRLLSAARQVVRNASREQTIGGMLARIQSSLVEGFRALGMWVHTFDEDGHGLGSIYAANGAQVSMPHELVRVAEVAAAVAWRDQQVGIVSRGIPREEQVSRVPETEFNQILEFLEAIGVGSVLFVPLGAGLECLGSLVLTRALGDSDWSEMETETALEIGRDLGRLVLNARAFERERVLVTELQALDAYKSNLIATLSHELKSPLAAMLANLELLHEVDRVDPEVRTVLSAVDRGATRLVRVVEDLLLLAKVGDPHTPLIVQPVDVRGVLEEVITLTSLAAQDRVRVLVQGPAGVASRVVALGGPAEIEILVTNLVNNALKYSPADSPVTVTLRRSVDEVCVAITDRGIGISRTDQGRLFEEFFRSDSAEVRKQAGTGLGLAICDRIVARHGGRIEVESELGEGTTFRVYLPAAD